MTEKPRARLDLGTGIWHLANQEKATSQIEGVSSTSESDQQETQTQIEGRASMGPGGAVVPNREQGGVPGVSESDQQQNDTPSPGSEAEGKPQALEDFSIDVGDKKIILTGYNYKRPAAPKAPVAPDTPTATPSEAPNPDAAPIKNQEPPWSADPSTWTDGQRLAVEKARRDSREPSARRVEPWDEKKKKTYEATVGQYAKARESRSGDLQVQINEYRALRKDLRLMRKIYLEKQAEVETKDGLVDQIKRRFSDGLKGDFSKAKHKADVAYKDYTQGLEDMYDKHAALLESFKESGRIHVEKTFDEMTIQERADSSKQNDRKYEKRIVKKLAANSDNESPEMQKVKERKIVAWCDTLFTKRMAQDLDSIERLSAEKKSKTEGRYTRSLKAIYGWYRKQPLPMKIFVGSAVGAAVGAVWAGGGVVAGAALAPALFARRIAGSTVGVLAGMGTYAAVNKVMSGFTAGTEKKIVGQMGEGYKGLDGTKEEGKLVIESFQKNMEGMRGVRKLARTGKLVAMGTSAGVAMLAGRGVSAAMGDAIDSFSQRPTSQVSGSVGTPASKVLPQKLTGPVESVQRAVVLKGPEIFKNPSVTVTHSLAGSRSVALEGTYQKGESVERVIQNKVFSDLAPDQKGRAAHLLVEKLKTRPGVENDLGVQRGDFSKVLAGEGYKLEVPQQDLEEVIKAVTEQDSSTSGQEVTLKDGTLRLRGTYGPGSSVERELQTLIKERYADLKLTKDQVGAIAHRAQLDLAKGIGATDAGKGFGIQRGDWDTVPKGGRYDVAFDPRVVLDKNIARVTGMTVEDVAKNQIPAEAQSPIQTPPVTVAGGAPTLVPESPTTHTAPEVPALDKGQIKNILLNKNGIRTVGVTNVATVQMDLNRLPVLNQSSFVSVAESNQVKEALWKTVGKDDIMVSHWDKLHNLPLRSVLNGTDLRPDTKAAIQHSLSRFFQNRPDIADKIAGKVSEDPSYTIGNAVKDAVIASRPKAFASTLLTETPATPASVEPAAPFNITESSHVQNAAKGFEGVLAKWFPYRGPYPDPALESVLEKGGISKDWLASGGETLRKYWPLIKEVRLTDLGVKGNVSTIVLRGEPVPISPEMVGFLRSLGKGMSDGDPVTQKMFLEPPLASGHMTLGDVVQEKCARYISAKSPVSPTPQGISLEAVPITSKSPIPEAPPAPEQMFRKIDQLLRKGDFHYRNFTDTVVNAELSGLPDDGMYRSVMTPEKLNVTLGTLDIPTQIAEILKQNWEHLNPVPVSEVIDAKTGISFTQRVAGDGPSPRTVELSGNVENLMRDVLTDFAQDENIARVMGEAVVGDQHITFGDLLQKIYEYQEHQRATARQTITV